MRSCGYHFGLHASSLCDCPANAQVGAELILESSVTFAPDEIDYVYVLPSQTALTSAFTIMEVLHTKQEC